MAIKGIIDKNKEYKPKALVDPKKNKILLPKV